MKLAGSVVTRDGSTAWVAENHGGLKYEGRLEWLPFGLFGSFGQYRQADLAREVQSCNSDEYRDDWVIAAAWLFGP